ncbi:uncharacterized [Tachysurus ichikawai]
MQARVIFLPFCPGAQGDCTSPELSHAIGIKASLTGTPQGRRESAGLFWSGSVKEKMEAADGTRRPMLMKVMKFGILVCDESSLSTPQLREENAQGIRSLE